MKLLFDKLKTSDGIVRVSFDDEVTWNEYNVVDVKDTGITFTEDDCPDLTKIRIAGAITKISDIKTHIINESISQDLTTSEQIENLRIQVNNLANNSSNNEELTILKNRFENYLWTQATPKNMAWEGATVAEIYNFKEFTKTIPFTSPIKIKQGNQYLSVRDILPSTDIPNMGEIQTAIANVRHFSDLENVPWISMNDLAANFLYYTYSGLQLNFRQYFTALELIGDVSMSWPDPLQLTGRDIIYLLTGITDPNMAPDNDYINYYKDKLNYVCLDCQFITNGLLCSLFDENSYTIDIDNMINKVQLYSISSYNEYSTYYYDNYLSYMGSSIDTSPSIKSLIDICTPIEGKNNESSFFIRLTTLFLQECKNQNSNLNLTQYIYADLYFNTYSTPAYTNPRDVLCNFLNIFDKLYITKDDNNLIVKLYSRTQREYPDAPTISYKDLPF